MDAAGYHDYYSEQLTSGTIGHGLLLHVYNSWIVRFGPIVRDIYNSASDQHSL
jgi:hypothetical protein